MKPKMRYGLTRAKVARIRADQKKSAERMLGRVKPFKEWKREISPTAAMTDLYKFVLLELWNSAKGGRGG